MHTKRDIGKCKKEHNEFHIKEMEKHPDKEVACCQKSPLSSVVSGCQNAWNCVGPECLGFLEFFYPESPRPEDLFKGDF